MSFANSLRVIALPAPQTVGAVISLLGAVTGACPALVELALISGDDAEGYQLNCVIKQAMDDDTGTSSLPNSGYSVLDLASVQDGEQLFACVTTFIRSCNELYAVHLPTIRCNAMIG